MGTRYSLKGTYAEGQVVDPAPPAKGPGQPRYTRGAAVNRKSKKVKKVNACVTEALAGRNFSDRMAVRDAFTKAVKQCSV